MNGYTPLALAIAAILSIVIARPLRQRRSGTGVAATTMLSIEQLTSLLARDAVWVVDVRTRDDFNGEQGHLAGAVHLPLEALAARIAELGENRAQAIALICRTDRKSAVAAALLAGHGFTAARAVRRDMTAWRERGLPTTHDLTRH